MKLITKTLARKIPALYAQDGKGMEATAFAKLFTPWAGWTWYVTEMDPETGECFGLVDGHERELGYFSLAELEAVAGPAGLRIERDLHWSPRPLSQV